MKTLQQLVAVNPSIQKDGEILVPNKFRTIPIRIAVTHLVFGLFVILLSDVFAWFGMLNSQHFVWATTVGTLVIVVSSTVVYWRCHRELSGIDRENLLLHAIMNTTTDAVYVKDTNGKYLYINEAAAKFHSAPVAAILGRDDTELFDAEGARRVMAWDQKIMQTGPEVAYDQVLWTGGVPKYFFTAKSPLRDTNGKAIGVVGISRDVTAQRQSDEALISAQAESDLRFAQLKAVVTSLDEGVVISDADGNMNEWNEAALSMLGFKSLDEAKQNINSFSDTFIVSTPNGPPLPISQWPTSRLSRGEPVVNLELVVCRSDSDHRKTINFNGKRIHGSTGKTELVVLTMHDVTERRKFEEELQGSERRFRILANTIPQIVWVSTADGTVTHLNTKTFEYIGYVVEDFCQWSWEQIIHPDDRQRVAEYQKEIHRTGLVRSIEYRLKRSDGTYRWHLSRQMPVRNSAGKIIQWYGTSTDIEGLKRNEEELHRSKAMLQLILDNIPQGVFWKDRNSVYLGCNQAVAKAMALTSPEAIVGLATDKDPSITWEEATFFRQKDLEVMESGVAQYHIVETMTLKNGATVWLDTNKIPIRDQDGEIIGVLGTWEDITERRMAEEKLRTSEATLRLFIEYTPAHIAMLDHDMRYIHASRRWYSDYRLSDPDITGKSHYDVFPNLPERWKVAHRRSLAGSIEHCDDDCLIFDDGSVQYIRWQTVPWTRADGEIGGIVIFTENISDWKLAQKEQHKLIKIIEHSQDFIATADLKGRVSYLNHGGRNMIGLGESDDLEDLNFAEYVPEVWQSFFKNTVIPTALEQGQWEGEMQLQHMKSGELIDVFRTVLLIRDDITNESWFATVTRDITEQKRTQSKLQGVQDRMARTIESVPIAICSFATTEDGRAYMPFASPQIYDIYELSPADVAEDFAPAFNKIFDEDRTRVIENIQQSAARMTAWRDQFRVYHSVRGTIWVEGHSTPSRQKDGTILWHGYIADITDRKQKEQELNETVSKLQISEKRFRQLADSSPQMVWVLDPQGSLIQANRTAYQYTGLSDAEMLDVNWHKTIHPDDLDRSLEHVTDCLKAGLPIDYETRLRRADGEYRWHVVRASAIRDDAGDIVAWYGTNTDIEQLKQTEQTLRERERFLRFITSAARVGMIVMNDSYEILFANEAYAELIDSEVNQIVGCRVPDVNPFGWPQIKPNIDRVLAGERVVFEVKMPPLPGQTNPRWNRAISQPLNADAAQPTTVTVIMDITELKQTKQQIDESEERYRRLIEVLPCALFVHNGQETLFGNPAFVRLIGATAINDLIGRNPFDFVDASFHDILRNQAPILHRTGKISRAMEMQAVRIDGKHIPVNVIGTSIKGYGDQAYLVVLSDLTERERSMNLLHSVMDSVTDAILTINEQAIVISANSATEALFGYSLSEILGNKINLLMPERYQNEYESYIANYLRTGVAKVIGIGREVEGQRKDGTIIPLDLNVSEFRLNGDRHFTGVLRDITSRKRLESELLHSQKLEAVGRLAGGVAHDFNNLLTVINGYANLVLTALSTTDPHRESLMAILEAGERAAHLTGQLLSFSRKAIYEPKIIDLNEIIEKSVLMLRRLIEEDIQLTVLLSRTIHRINAAPGQLEQILMNLVVNARDAMPDGGRLILETKTVTVGSQDQATFPDLNPGEYVQLSVTDTGVGMTNEVKEKIFEPFFTTKAIGKGTGLGLAVVHGVVKQCGGSIIVESAINVGTTFKLLFPAVSQISEGTDTGVSRIPAQGKETVLLVEDEKAVRKIARIALESHGYKVVEAVGGAEAIQIVDNFPGTIDLLLTDVVMPEINGLKLADALRQRKPNLRVLYMTGYTDEAVLQRGLSDTNDELLQKPFTAIALARKVRSILDRKN